MSRLLSSCICSFCSKSWDRSLSMCKCEAVRYCDKECQKKDWSSHRKTCKRDCNKEFAKVGVRASYICSIYSLDEIKDLTTDQVVLNLILRDTVLVDSEGRSNGMSMAEKLKKNPDTRQHVNESATSYVIHAWKYKWSDLIGAISSSSLDPDRFIWLDALCVNQHEGFHDIVPDWWFYGVHEVIRSCSHVELVLLPWDNPIPVQRAWCVWEIFGAHEKDLDQLKILMTPEQKSRFENSIKTGQLNFETFQKVFSDINIERAQTTNFHDYKKIIKEIKRIGLVKVNNLVLLPLKLWLEEAIEKINTDGWNETELIHRITCNGELYHSLGKLETACKYFDQALERLVAKNNNVENNKEVVEGLNNLAAVLMDMGKFDKAQKVLERAMRSCENMFGVVGNPERNNSLMAITISNYALNFHHLGKLEKARNLYEDALKIDQKLMNQDAESAVRLNNSAKLAQDMGDFKTAQLRFKQALPILQKFNGDDHPSYATLQNNLALLACAMGNMDEAKTQFECSLESLKRTLGKEHPSVAGALNNIAAMYNAQGDHVKAENYFKEALLIQKAALGEEHPDVATTLNNLASVYSNSGQYEMAFDLGKEALNIWNTSTGPNSPQTKAARKLWGGNYVPSSPPPQFGLGSCRSEEVDSKSPRRTRKKSVTNSPQVSSPLRVNSPRKGVRPSADKTTRSNSRTSSGSQSTTSIPKLNSTADLPEVSDCDADDFDFQRIAAGVSRFSLNN